MGVHGRLGLALVVRRRNLAACAWTDAVLDACADDPDWYKDGNPSRIYEWIGKDTAARCLNDSNESPGGFFAYEACQSSCGCA